jgi:hypothetical protein
MPHASRSRTPKLEPEVLDRSQGSVSLGGAMSPSHSIGRVSGANASQADAGDMAPLTIALCDGSQFTFSRLVDLRTSADT